MVQSHDSETVSQSLIGAILIALGIVYGDIGTSPLYAMTEIFFGHSGIAPSPLNVLGALGLIIWLGLVPLITIKYTFFVLRADNGGEGGVFALFGLLNGKVFLGASAITIALVFSAGLLYGDGLITPAISFLAAVEGLKVITPAFEPYVKWIACGLIFLLFSIQYRGIEKIGKAFGPIVLLWFISITVLGIRSVWLAPDVLRVLEPIHGLYYAWTFMQDIGFGNTLMVLGSVMLVATGGEAMYADLGHCGRLPIQRGWLMIAFPALLLNYLGQGAYLLSGAEVIEGNIFYSMVPHGATSIPFLGIKIPFVLWGMVVLATLATGIASQALISGVFSLASQSIALGLLPRFRIKHTSDTHAGQIYLPMINWVLCIGCMALVVIFGSASKLAMAYGLAVSGVMLFTSVTMVTIGAVVWQWSIVKTLLIFGSFAAIEFTFLTANVLKFLHGGYLPLAIALLAFAVMMTWRWGRKLLADQYDAYGQKRKMSWLITLKARTAAAGGVLIDGSKFLVQTDRAATFMVSRRVASVEDSIPITLRDYMKRQGSLPQFIILLHIQHEKAAYIAEEERYEIMDFGSCVWSVMVRVGFMEQPDVPTILRRLNHELSLERHDLSRCAIEVGEEELIITETAPGLTRILAKFFRLLLRQSVPAHHHYGLRGNPVIYRNVIPVYIDRDGITIRLFDYDYPD